MISLCLSDRQHTQHEHKLLSENLVVICAAKRLQSQVGKHEIRKQMTGQAKPPESLNFGDLLIAACVYYSFQSAAVLLHLELKP